MPKMQEKITLKMSDLVYEIFKVIDKMESM